MYKLVIIGLPRHFQDRSQIAKFMGPTWGPPGSCRTQVGPMLAPWTLLSGMLVHHQLDCYEENWMQLMEEIQQFHSLENFTLNQNTIFLFKKCIWKWCLQHVSHFVGTSMYQSRRQPANGQLNLTRAHHWEKLSSHYRVMAVAELIWTTYSGQYKLEQLERLCSEIPPTTTWLPIIVIHIRSQVKTRQSQKCKFEKKCQKIQFWNFARNFTHDTPSEVAW